MSRQIRRALRNVRWWLTWYMPRYLTSASFRETWHVLDLQERLRQILIEMAFLEAYYAAQIWVEGVVESMQPIIQYIQELDA